MSTRLHRAFSLAVVLCMVLGSEAFALGGGTDPSLAGWWRFDDGSGTVARDSSGNGNDGTLSTTPPTWTVGMLDGALQFNGTNNTSVVAPHIAMDNRSFTVALWVNPVLTASAVAFCQHQSSANNMSLHIRLGGPTSTDAPKNGIRLGFYKNDLSSPASLLQDNTWYHIACSYDSTSGARTIYLNGVSKATDTSASPILATTAVNTIGSYSSKGQPFTGLIDDVRVYQKALAADEVAIIMAGSVNLGADSPSPGHARADVPRDTVLSWTAGPYAQTHDVYFGTAFDDVNRASLASPKGVLVSQGQSVTTFDPASLFAFGQTYYWRVDEVNAAPDFTTFKGSVWSFTAEPYAYAIKPTRATASSSYSSSMGPEKTIDGSGLNTSDQHSITEADMWLSIASGPNPAWIQYDFDRVYRLSQLWVWNSNQAVEPSIGFGARDVAVEVSTDGSTWTAVENVPVFAQATGSANYAHNTTVDLGGALAQHIRLTIKNNWGDLSPQVGLSEVRFFQVPTRAFQPAPANSATGVALDATLNWRPGREAAQHQVAFGTDATAVANGTAALKTVSEHQVSLSSLSAEYNQTYYWKVNEVNDAATPASWTGDLWSFTTAPFRVIEDFESYDDNCTRIFFSWIDGFGHSGSTACAVPPSSGNGTGSTVGNINPPFAERTTVHSGSQAMPFWFDNSKTPFYSETIREWGTAQSWTAGAANTLTVWFRGDPASFIETSSVTIAMANEVYVGLAVTSHAANAACGASFSNVSTSGTVTGSWQTADLGVQQVNGNAAGTFYVAVQDSTGKLKAVSHPDALAIATGQWQEWSIPLSEFSSAGVDLNGVKRMILGVGNRVSPAAGSAGKLCIDDIRLTKVGP